MFCRPWHLSALIMMSIHPRITTGWPCIRVYEFLSFISWPFGYCYCFVHLDCIFLSRVLDTPEVEIRARFCFVYFLYKSIPRTHILSRRICLCHPGREERRTTSHAIFLFAACYLLSSMENSDWYTYNRSQIGIKVQRCLSWKLPIWLSNNKLGQALPHFTIHSTYFTLWMGLTVCDPLLLSNKLY